MASREDLYAALRAADKAGDVEGAKRLAQYIGSLPPEEGPAKAPTSMLQHGGNLVAGAVRGAGSIGATLLAPIDMALDAIDGKGLSLESNRQRRANMDAALAEMGAETESNTYGLGKVVVEIAGTAGAGGALAQGAARVAPTLVARMPALVEAVATTGMRAGATTGKVNALTRAAGGGISGAAGSALVNPDDALAGGVIGAVTPSVLQGLGKAGRAVGKPFRSAQTKAGETIAQALDLTTPEAVAEAAAKLRGARELVPGSVPTVAQVLQTPQAGILQRVVHDSAGGGVLRDQLAAQNTARLNALEALAPGAPGRTAIEAADNFGSTLSAEAGEWEGILKGVRGEQYAKAERTATLSMPDKESALAVIKRIYPAGVIEGDPNAAMVSGFAKRLQGGEPIPLAEFDQLRKIAGNRARDLGNTDLTAAKAWGDLKGLFDEAEQAALDKGARLTPTGQGAWGPEFSGLSGDPQNAVAHLLRTGQGSVPAAATNKMAGPVDFVAGNPVKAGPGAFGLLHVDAKGRDEALRRLPDLASDGVPYSRLQETRSGKLQPKGGRKDWFYVGDGDYEALLRGDYNFKPTGRAWSHTAYKIDAEKRLPAGAGQSSSATSLTVPAQTSAPTTGASSVPPTTVTTKVDRSGRTVAANHFPPNPDHDAFRAAIERGDQEAAVSALTRIREAEGRVISADDRAVVALQTRSTGRAQPAAKVPEPDIEESFNAFNRLVNPPPPLRDPRQYTGDLAGALTAEEGQAIRTGRAVHGDIVDRFRTGPAYYMNRTGPDGKPVAEGAELARRFLNSGGSQKADAEQLKKAVLERGPTMQAARDYVMANMLEQVAKGGQVSPASFRNHTTARSLMLKEVMTPEQLAALGNVGDDLARASSAAGAGRTLGGSDTFQKAQNALSLGLLDNPLMNAAAGRIPVGGAGLSWLRETVREGKARQLAALLSDSPSAARALEAAMGGNPNAIQRLLANPDFQAAALRLAPALAADR